MDTTVRTLLRFVGRSFYGKPYVLILDSLLLHSVLSEDDMSYLLGIQRKELRSLCNRLVEDRLITMHIQREGGHPGQRPQSKTYYFIHNTEAIDSVKWKTQAVVQQMKKELSGEANPQGYICPVCKTKYSQLDAMALMNFEMNEFICSLCNVALIEDDTGKVAKENQEKYSRLMKQIEPIIECLRKIDEHTVLENNFETCLAKMIPAQARTSAQYIVSNYKKSTKMFDRNSYLNNRSSLQAGARSHATLHVNISTEDGDLQREKLAVEQDEKRKQNALPSWHEESTIGKSLGKLDGQDEEDADMADGDVKLEDLDKNGVPIVKEETRSAPTVPQESEQKPDVVPVSASASAVSADDAEQEDALAKYYSELEERAKKEEEDDRDDDEDEDEEDEDDDEFDDIEFDDVDLEDVEINQGPQSNPPITTQEERAVVDDIVEEMEFDSDEE